MIGPPRSEAAAASSGIVGLENTRAAEYHVNHSQDRMNTIVKELLAPDGKWKVQVFRRGHGSFGFESLRFSEEPLEMCWIPHGRFSECFAPSADIAEREARGRVDWLRNENGDG